MVATRLSNKNKTNPLSVLPQEVFDDVADYLSEQDVLSCTLVSRSWYGAVIRSRSAMSKLTILYQKHGKRKLLDWLLESDRPYQNIVFDIRSFEYNQRNDAEKNFRNLLRKFVSTIESIDTNADLNGIFDLPQLKSLRFLNCVTLYPDGLMSKNKKIENLTVKCGSRSSHTCSAEIIKNALRTMEKLKFLDIDRYFEFSSIENHDFSLKTFKNKDSGTLSLVLDFLRLHRDTLTFIEIQSLGDESEITALLTEFPKLHVLNIRYLFSIPQDLKSLPTNESITELKISHWQSLSLTLIRKFKSLKIFAVPHISANLLKFILASTTICEVPHVSMCYLKKRDKLYIEMINSPINFYQVDGEEF